MDSTAKADGHLFLGMDIGAVNVRMAVVNQSGQLVYLDSERIVKGPAAAVAALIKRLEEALPAANIMGAGATGSGRDIYDGQDGWQIFTSPYSAIAGLLWDNPDAKTIIALGGQSSIVIGLEGGMDKPWRVARSPLCAAGTGRFLEQQSSRLGIQIEGFGPRALEWTKSPPRVAARCSVFAKSDLIHLQQKGWPVPAMLAGLSDSVARMIQSQWRDDFVPPVYFIGGVAANEAVIRALNAMVSQPIIVPANPAMREAIGAALLTREAPAHPVALYPHDDGESETYTIERRLAQTVSTNGWKPWEYADKVMDVYLGVDIGSTSTKAAIIDAEGKVLVKNYLMTAGQPLEAVKELMANLAPLVEGKVRVKAVGVTGSGRYLVGNFIGADLIKNEITAQTRAAMQTDRQINTIFELGGQDSKYVYLDNAVVLDYQMNKACAAGTGSFIDELAEQLSISTRTGEFADMAFAAETQLDLGERCAVFMSQAVTSAQHAGVSSEIIVSSLATSLAKNYLSKVVGGRRVGNRIYLTGAVFYNEAVVSAFQSEYPGKTFVVPEHKEVTGAIGAALLAKESLSLDRPSGFKGFSKVVAETYKLTNFNCNRCEHCCSISVMTTGIGQRLFYGSRCDLYDADSGPVKKGKFSPPPTPFTAREELLFEGYNPAVGTGVLVGVPRALLTYDLAPLFTGFLNALGVRVRYSSPTNKVLIEKSLEQAYSDSCFPIKLVHGHVAELLDEGAEYILLPNAIRMARKDGEEDQRYSCPLVQGAPYIINSVFGLGKRLLDPIIDLSMGDELVIRSFVDLAGRLGFSKKQGEEAARQGLARQREFEIKLRETGQKVIDDLAANPDSLGVVLLSRAYNAQDAGANLGMANALQRLGVVPIPMDFLPLDQVDVKEITDRPYWNYERKILAASKIIAENPQIFGLFLSNFGCGPNSFIENIVEDIMGGKPLGHIEIDEHAAEAGYITRIEALVDTLKGYRRAGLHLAGDPEKYARRVRTSVESGQNVLVVRMSDHADIVAAAMRAFGVNAQVLPESDDRSMGLSRDVTSGKECLPFRDTLGVYLRMAEDGLLPKNARAIMAGSYGPCRLGKYAQEQQKILDERGIPLEIMTTVSNDGYSDIGLGNKFELLAWQGIIANDLLQKMLWRTRPYERKIGDGNLIYEEFLARLTKAVEGRQPLEGVLREAMAALDDIRDKSLPRRPLVGINGEIYLRSNRFCNKDLAMLCESHGLEVEISPMTEWINYITLRNMEDALVNRDLRKIAKSYLRKKTTGYYEKRSYGWVKKLISELEPSPALLMATSAPYLPGRCGSEAVLSLGSGIRQMNDPHFAAVISVMPHGCMPGGIVGAISEAIAKKLGNKPWISLTYDGFADKVNPERIADLAEQLRHRQHK